MTRTRLTCVLAWLHLLQSHHFLSAQECKDRGDFRAEQCSNYDELMYNGQHGHTWIPLPTSDGTRVSHTASVTLSFGARISVEPYDTR